MAQRAATATRRSSVATQLSERQGDHAHRGLRTRLELHARVRAPLQPCSNTLSQAGLGPLGAEIYGCHRLPGGGEGIARSRCASAAARVARHTMPHGQTPLAAGIAAAVERLYRAAHPGPIDCEPAGSA